MTAPDPSIPYVPASTVIDAVARRFVVPAERIRGKGRARIFTRARAAAVWILRRTGGENMQSRSYPAVGRMLGNRDHSTIIHADQCCEAWMRADPDYRSAVQDLFAALVAKDGSIEMMLPARPVIALPRPACVALTDGLPTLLRRNDFSDLPEDRDQGAVNRDELTASSARLRDAVLAELVGIGERRGALSNV